MWSGVKPNLAGTYCKFYLRGNSSEKNHPPFSVECCILFNGKRLH